jgi:hypothetical protein
VADVNIDNAFFEKLGRDPGVIAECVKKAEQVAGIARSTAPRDTNQYANSIRVQVVARSHRNAALVVAGDDKSLLIESFTGNLARALNQVKKSG